MGLFFVAMANVLLVAVMISAGHVSGGHLNPAVTFGLLVGGHITVVRSILYWIDQLIASAGACYLLHYLTGGLVSVIFYIHSINFDKNLTIEIVLLYFHLFNWYLHFFYSNVIEMYMSMYKSLVKKLSFFSIFFFDKKKKLCILFDIFLNNKHLCIFP